MYRRVLLIYFSIIFLFFLSPVKASEDLSEFRFFLNKKIQNQILKISKKTLKTFLQGHQFSKVSFEVESKKSFGVFVTLIKDGKARGCMGGVFPTHKNLSGQIAYFTVLAATQDKRFPPVKYSELDEIKCIISIIGKPKRIYNKDLLNPEKYGLLIRKREKSAVLLPGEAKTSLWQLEECKRKAGISLNQDVEMYIFETITIEG